MGMFDSRINAFKPFFRDEAVVSGTRPGDGEGVIRTFRETVKVCVMDDSVDALSDGAVAPSGESSRTVLIPVCDWVDETPPQAGDLVELSDGTRCRTRSVVVGALCFFLSTRGERTQPWR